MTDNQNPFSHLVSPLEVNGQTYEYVSIPALNDPRVDKLPHSIRVLLECALRCCDGELFTPENVENILSWGGDGGTAGKVAVTFRPSRVVMQGKPSSGPKKSGGLRGQQGAESRRRVLNLVVFFFDFLAARLVRLLITHTHTLLHAAVILLAFWLHIIRLYGKPEQTPERFLVNDE